MILNSQERLVRFGLYPRAKPKRIRRGRLPAEERSFNPSFAIAVVHAHPLGEKIGAHSTKSAWLEQGDTLLSS